MGRRPKALVLGGTEFLGIHLLAALARDGWDVTAFNRGKTNPGMFDSLPQLRGDRDTDVSALVGRQWDVVYDLSAFHPDQVERSAEHLAGQCRHYVFVSTISAYADLSRPGATEDAPLATLDGPVPDEVDGASYGPLKALCEHRVSSLFDSCTIVRPSIIVGPHDPSDRFTYWVLRLSVPGPHVVPPAGDAQVQYIDARDLAQWLVQVGSGRLQGTFNAAAEPIRFADFLAAVAAQAGVPYRPVALTEDQMAAEKVRAWLDLPMWLPPSDETKRGFFAVDAARAASAGLLTRPLGDTVQDTLTWARGRNATEQRCGLAPERDAELAARYGNNE